MAMLGIIAGGGEAPKRLMAACRALGRSFCFIALKGQTDPDIGNDDVPHQWLPIGAAQAAIDFGRKHSVRDVVLLGRVKRPSLFDLKPDATLFKKLLHMAPAFFRGDDTLLKAVSKEFDVEGFRIIAPQQVFSDLLMPEGVLGRIAPNERAWADIAQGFKAARALGALDVGQAVVMQNGMPIAMEGAEHTDALIRRSVALKQEGPGPVLVKVKKPQQDPRFDLPSLGVNTVKEAIAAGFSGIAAEAGASLLIDRDEVVRLADEAGIFVTGVTEND